MNKGNGKMTYSDFAGFEDALWNLVRYESGKMKYSRFLDSQGCILTWEAYKGWYNWINELFADCGVC